ncbi:Protein C [Photobacterium marinum]|uniref:Protein C n=1 Tax=Photobacterium marinum TaxID=1056511 RepID=L8J8V3_9GAMM|nr:serine protease [Photobacterium marinum]ELR65275.1 Protein C [Photobacterium marinum]
MCKLLFRLLFSLSIWFSFLAVPFAAAEDELPSGQLNASNVMLSSVTPKIIGGIDSSANEIPWQAYLNMTFPNGNGGQSTFVCGGVVISQDVVLTAAHCLRNGSDTVTTQNIKVWAGGVSLFSFSSFNAIDVSEFVIHPSYNSARFANDIAILKLATSLPSTAIPIKMTDSATQNRVDNAFDLGWVANSEREPNLLVSGWGATDPNNTSSGSTRLRQTVLSGVPDIACDAQWGSNMSPLDYPIFLCAGSVSPTLGRDSCFGDSGGPLVWQDPQASSDSDFGLRLVGLVSFGNGCAGILPGVYTEVANYQSWIEQEVGAAVNTQPTSIFASNPFTRDYSNAGEGLGSGGNVTPNSGDGDGGYIGGGGMLGLLVVGYWRRRIISIV